MASSTVTPPPSQLVPQSLEDLLRARHGSLVPLIRRHEGNRLVSESPPGDNWRVTTTSKAVDETTQDLTVSFELLAGEERQTAVAVAFAFEEWHAEDYLLLPAAVYQGNDFQVFATSYPPLWRDPSQFRPDMPVTITPAPRLAQDSPRLEQTTGDTASPCMAIHSRRRGCGFLVQTTQASRLGNHGLTAERTGAGIRLVVSAPCVREVRQDHCKGVPSDDRAADWRQGEQVSFQFRVVFYEDGSLQSLFDHYAALRKSLNPSQPRHTLPFSAAWRIVEEKFNRSNWVATHGYYKMAPNYHTTFEIADDPLCFQWQLGWVGGGMMTLPMLAQGNPLTRERAWQNLRMIFDKTRGPAGLFRGIGDGERFYPDGFDRPMPHRLQMVRKNGDWLLFALKHFDLMQQQGREVPAAWNDAIRALADALVRLFYQHGQFGQFVDGDTGELLIGGSAAGAIIPAGLARASRWFGEPRYLEVADAAGRSYYQQFVTAGLSTGGPGEILSAPDSESAFALVESFVTLFELTGAPFHAEAAREAIAQASTWVVSYDFRFPPASTLAVAGVRSTGAVFANIQNKHGAPGICTLSGDALFRFWRATGDPLALDLIRDIAHGIPQYLSRADQPLGEAMQPGWMCERVNLSDWEGAGGVGDKLFGSCSWAETALMLTTWEIPGIYVRPDTGTLVVFDHLEVMITRRQASAITLEIHNPTGFDAETRVLCEVATAVSTPLRLNALLGAETIAVPSGATVTHTFASHE